MPRVAEVNQGAEFFVYYDNEYYNDVEVPKTFDTLKDLCKSTGLKYKTLIEYYAKKRQLKTQSIYKVFKDKRKKMIRVY